MPLHRSRQTAVLAAALRDLAWPRHIDAGAVRRRVFVVGCPRSGTTLLQSLLHAHRDIHSLPETHFFQRLLACEELRQCRQSLPRSKAMQREWRERRRRLLAAAGWVDARRAQRAWSQLHEAGLDARPPQGLDAWRLPAQVHAFVAAMDRHCLGACKTAWLEKTPDHLYYVDAIQRHLPEARFVHVIRDGEEVVSSLYRAAQSYPPWRPYLDLDRCVSRWRRAVAESLRWRDDPRHHLVRYEDLALAPRDTVSRTLAFLGCDEDAGLWARHRRTAAQLITAGEPWKRGNLDPIVPRRHFQATFDQDQQRRIRRALLTAACA